MSQPWNARSLLDPKGALKTSPAKSKAHSQPQQQAAASSVNPQPIAFSTSSPSHPGRSHQEYHHSSSFAGSSHQPFDFGSTLNRLHRAEQRTEPLPKRQKVHQTQQGEQEEDEEVPFQQRQKEQARRSGGGILGQYVRDKQKEGAEERAKQMANTVDLTAEADDDVVIVSGGNASVNAADAEVCVGRIDGAKVNAHRVPNPKNSAFAGNKFWPPMKSTLVRRAGNNTHIIGVIDPLNKDFGTIDVRTATVLAPLMDQSPLSKTRFSARLDGRKREPFEAPGQSCSETFNIQINIYAPRRMAAGIGKIFSQKNIFLVKPLNMPYNVEYVNPHDPKDYGPTKKAGSTSTSRYTFHGGPVSRTQEEVRRDVYRIFDAIQENDTLPEMENPCLIRTPLLRHQRQALWFMTDREKDKRADAVDQHSSMWQKQHGFSKSSWYHIITGHSMNEEPEPTRGGILADVMGLGKTLNVLSLVVSSLDQTADWTAQAPSEEELGDFPALTYNARATLLICPLSTVANWEEQIRQHLSNGKDTLRYTVHHGNTRTNDSADFRNYDLVITTYPITAADASQRMRRPRNPLAEVNWFRIVLDEAHLIREQSNLQSKAVCALSAQRRWAVTGTPVQNRLDDLGALFKFLRVRPFEETKNFNQFIIAPFKTADTEILPKLRLLVDSITLRRLKDKLDLPAREEKLVRLEMSDSERSFYELFARESQKGVRDMLKQSKIGSSGYAQVLKAILRLRLMCAAGQDLLSDEDWDLARGFHADTAIDLEEIEYEKPDRTVRQAMELFRMMRDTAYNYCAGCGKHINLREVIDAEESDDDESVGSETDTIGYFANCNQLICVKCLPGFKKQCEARTNSDNFGSCPICETYMRMTFFELKQSEFDAEEKTLRDVRSNPRLARQLGRYTGPHTKTRALIERLEENAKESAQLAEAGEPPIRSVIFSGWTGHLDLIQIALTKSHVNFVRLDGSMSRRARGEALDAFASDPEVTCILVSIAAGGLGLNLTSASQVFVMEPQYNPAAEAQAVERVHRLGQKRPVTIFKYIMDNSFEEKMLIIQDRKKSLAEMSMEKSAQSQFDNTERAKQKMEELRELFR